MSQQAKAAKAPSDPYAARGKPLTSSVQRLRGWVGTDPGRAPELGDALVELTAHRLLGHGYAAAAADAQESVRRAAELLTAPGPIGPYTSVADAVRYVTAVVHLAALQTGIGQAEAAGRTLGSLDPLHLQLDEQGLELPLDPTTAVWALACAGRAALAGEEIATANAYADAAAARLAASGRGEDPELAYLALDVDRLVADGRWAAGRPADSLAVLRRARQRYDSLVDGRLATPGRLSPALLERLAEPLFGLYRDLADRLVATGETDTGLDVRRVLIDLLRGVVPRLGDRARLQLASSLSDLAADLAAADRSVEADAAAAEAEALVPDGSADLRTDRARDGLDRPQPLVSWSPLPPGNRYVAEGSAGAPVEVPDLWSDAWLEADRAEARRREAERRVQAQREAERAAAEQQAAQRAAAAERAAEEARAAAEQAREAERRAAAEEAERVERKRRREERLREHRRAELGREIEQLTADAAAGDPAAAPELERRRAELAQLDGAQPVVPEPVLPEPEVDAEPVAPTAPDELDLAEEAWTQARGRGDRRATRAANERVVELLRPRATAEPDGYAGRLQEALEALASVRLRGGDVFGSRSAAREARTLARRGDR